MCYIEMYPVVRFMSICCGCAYVVPTLLVCKSIQRGESSGYHLAQTSQPMTTESQHGQHGLLGASSVAVE